MAIQDGRGITPYCATVWAMKGGEWSARTRGVFTSDSIDSCTKAQTQTNILYRLRVKPLSVLGFRVKLGLNPD